MKISNRAIIALFAIIACCIALASVFWIFGNDWFLDADPILMEILQETVLLTSIALGAIFLLILASLYKISTTMGKVWLCLGIGMACWFIAELLFTYLDITAGSPFPSIADFFYLIAYPILATGLVLQSRLLKIMLNIKEKIAVLAGSLIASGIIFYIVILPIISAWGTTADTFSSFVGALYPVLDIFLLICVFIVFAKLRHGKINVAWILILLGFVSMTVADTLYQIYGSEIALFHLYDLVFLISYLLILAGSLKVINILTVSFKEA